MKDEPRATIRHQLDHAVPTVIHHPEDDLPLLARWLRRAMENQTRFWSLLGGLVFVVVLLAVLANGLPFGRTGSDEAWTKLEVAKRAAERVEIAKEYPNTQASRWALLQAATEFYSDGVRDLPANRDAALPTLRKALDLFEQVERESAKDSPLARAAALGAARALEARNQLDKAVAEYKRVAKAWPGTDEARQADRYARELEKPESVAFYKELYNYKPTELTLPPLGQGELKLPANHPPIGGGPSVPLPPPPSPTPSAGSEKPAAGSASPGGPKLPDDLFAPQSKGTTAKP